MSDFKGPVLFSVPLTCFIALPPFRLTKTGTLKDKTDCSPSNGYYFIPLYDKGDYVLKLSHPAGWSFENNEIEISFNGETDLCSQGKDVNFAFKGFGITGQVSVVGQKQGAPDVHVELTQPGQAKAIGSTRTDRFGVFSFSPIQPGKYLIKVSHDRWHFGTPEAEVEVTKGNTELEKGVLVVSGFDVIGKVTSDRQPFADVSLAVFPIISGSPTIEPKCTLQKPTNSQVTHANAAYQSRPVCSTTSGADGSYVFRGLAPGKYLVKAFFENPALKFNIEPREMEVEVVKDTVQMPAHFDVTGFDVTGRVLTAAGGSGVANARVTLNGGAHVVQTDASGGYALTNIKAGAYTIQVAAEDVQFTDHTVKIIGTNPHIPDIVVSAFKVCGAVVSGKSQKVAITKHASTFHTETQSAGDGSGKWCTYLPNGKFSVEVLTSGEEKQQGVQFFPLKHDIEVGSQPLTGITFSQLKAKVVGQVRCLSDAGALRQGLKVVLTAKDGTGRTATATVADSGDYSFEGILPGKYDASVLSSLVCWEESKAAVEVKSASETIPTFRQSGYKVAVIASHSTKMDYALRVAPVEGQQEVTKDTLHLELKSGLNEYCVSAAGTYDVQFHGCHSADAEKPLITSFRTGSESPFHVAFNRHRNGFKLATDHKEAFQVQIEQSGQKRVLDWKSLEVLSGNIYRHVLELKDGEAITITPVSETLLFKPASYELVGANDCADDRFTFKARTGLILNGRVQPAIKDARITLRLKSGVELKQVTNAQGTFKFGPIDTDSEDYELTAEKESYVFGSYDKAQGLFKAHKLCEIVVTVKDEAGQVLSGVLMSLSGGESYRKNLISGADGQINFHSLSPSQYFLKPMLKEYKFEPNSKMVQIADGETVQVELVGKRVAYSVFGTVTSLNGDPFPNVVLEAISEQCHFHQEETSSEANGGYRIRGLQPNCEYSIRAKKTADGVQSNVDRTIPAERIVHVQGDVPNVNMIAISPIGFVDVAARVKASTIEHYKTLRVALYKKGSNDNPVYNGKLEQPLATKSKTNPGVMIFFPRIPYDGKTYVIELTTTLSKSNHQYEIPSFEFPANRSSVFTEFEFAPEVKAAEPELNQNSIAALVLLCIVAFAFLKQDLFLELVGMAFNKVSAAVQELIEKNRRKDSRSEAAVLNDRDLDSLAKSINDVRKKKAKKA